MPISSSTDADGRLITGEVKRLGNPFLEFNNEDFAKVKNKSLDEIIDDDVKQVRVLISSMLSSRMISGLNSNEDETVSVYSAIFESVHKKKITDAEIMKKYGIDSGQIQQGIPEYVNPEAISTNSGMSLESYIKKVGKQMLLLQQEIKNIEIYLQKKNERRMNVLKDKGIPERYSDCSFDTYKPETEENAGNLKKIREYSGMKDNDRVLLMLGPAGVGKTHLACAVLREHDGQYRKSADLEKEFEESRDFKSREKYSDLMKKYTGSPMLIIDGAGCSDKPDAEFRLLGLILNGRYDRKLPTVIVSSLEKIKLVGNLSRQTVDRLIETIIVLEFNGKSFRESKRAAAIPS